MGRPKTELEPNGAYCWRAVESVQRHIGANSEEMAAILGMSGGQYRGWRSRGEFPTEAWERFRAYQKTVSESSSYKEEGWALVWDRGTSAFIPRQLLYPVRECQNANSGYRGHRDTYIPRAINQKYCSIECRMDHVKRAKANQ